MPFDLPTSDQISALIGLPGIKMVQAGQQTQEAQQKMDRDTAAYNALRNIYGPIVGNLNYLQMQQAENQKATTNRTNTLLPGEVQAQRDVSAERQAQTNRNVQTLPYDIASSAASTASTTARTTSQDIMNQNAVQLRQLTAARLGAAQVDATLGYDPQTKTFRTDPEVVFGNLPPAVLQGLDIKPEDAKAWGAYVKAHPEAWQQFKDGLEQQHNILMTGGLSAGKGGPKIGSSVHYDDQGRAYTTINGQPHYLTDQNGQPIVSGVFSQKTPTYQGQVEQQKSYHAATGKAEGEKAASVLPPSATEIATAKLKAGTQFAQLDAQQRNLDLAISQADNAGIWSLPKFIPGTQAANLESSLKAEASNLVTNQINALKESAEKGQATGAGRIFKAEIDLWQNAYAAIEQSQTPAQLKQNLLYLKGVASGMRNRLGAYYQSRYGFDIPSGDTNAPGTPGIQQRTPSPAAIKMLQTHPETREKFDAVFGIGAASKVLGR